MEGHIPEIRFHVQGGSISALENYNRADDGKRGGRNALTASGAKAEKTLSSTLEAVTGPRTCINYSQKKRQRLLQNSRDRI